MDSVQRVWREPTMRTTNSSQAAGPQVALGARALSSKKSLNLHGVQTAQTAPSDLTAAPQRHQQNHLPHPQRQTSNDTSSLPELTYSESSSGSEYSPSSEKHAFANSVPEEATAAGQSKPRKHVPPPLALVSRGGSATATASQAPTHIQASLTRVRSERELHRPKPSGATLKHSQSYSVSGSGLVSNLATSSSSSLARSQSRSQLRRYEGLPAHSTCGAASSETQGKENTSLQAHAPSLHRSASSSRLNRSHSQSRSRAAKPGGSDCGHSAASPSVSVAGSSTSCDAASTISTSTSSAPRSPTKSSSLRRKASKSSMASSARTPREKKHYIPQGQRAGSIVPISFTGEFDEDGDPVFEDEWVPRGRRGRGMSEPKSSVSATTPVVVLEQEPAAPVAAGISEKKKKTLTIFDTFSFPLPPTPTPPMARSPSTVGGHRATASEGLIHSPLLAVPDHPHPAAASIAHAPSPLRRPGFGPRPLPRAPSPQQPSSQSTSPSSTSNVPTPTAFVSLPVTSPLSAKRSARLLSPRSISAGGINELGQQLHSQGPLQSFLSLHSPLPPMPMSGKVAEVGEVRIREEDDDMPLPPGSARAMDAGISFESAMGMDQLIGMVDAAIAA
ncbi:hypothetical protein DL93DRAFT_2084318 [Clavulina sp. PMI_390]|nr:hypothetical protein DL93DRAFT_2084318 [Clavulina sp. PMI_390]